MKVEIYDPAMCCSTGICGPNIDPSLIKINDAILALKKQGINVERHNLKTETANFLENKTVSELMHKNGKKVLPITLVNGSVLSTGTYPSYEDLCKVLGIEPLKDR